MTIDELAQEIRRVDGDNSLGAGTLAEAIVSFISRSAEPVAWGAWSELEQRVIAATTDKMKADTYDGRGDIKIVPLAIAPAHVDADARVKVENIVRLIVGREEHYVWAKDAKPLTDDHVFGDHVLIMKDRPELTKASAAHLEQRIRAITASTMSALASETE